MIILHLDLLRWLKAALFPCAPTKWNTLLQTQIGLLYLNMSVTLKSCVISFLTCSLMNVSQLEMRSQDLQLAQTLLGLNSEIQRLRRESFGGVDMDDQQWRPKENCLLALPSLQCLYEDGPDDFLLDVLKTLWKEVCEYVFVAVVDSQSWIFVFLPTYLWVQGNWLNMGL